MKKPVLKIFPDKQALFSGSAEIVTGLILESVNNRGICSLVLSGGSTPEGLFRILASGEYKDNLPWDKVHFFWGDERCVPPGHADSNYRMAKESMLDELQVPGENIHRIHGEKSPDTAAREYEETIRKFFTGTPDFPEFDIVLLGLGEDGHTASLFPGTTALQEEQRWVTALFVPKLNASRITLTLPVLNNSRNVIFLVSGESKSAVLNEIYSGEGKSYPAAHVIPGHGSLMYLADSEAAGEIV